MSDPQLQSPVQEVAEGEPASIAPPAESTDAEPGAPGSPPDTEPRAGETLQDTVPPPDVELQGGEEQGGVALPEKRALGGLESVVEQPAEETEELSSHVVSQNLSPPLLELRRGGIVSAKGQKY